ncbi:MAG: hypothetical protein IT282_03740 [Bacteroidetes bacterium]|nr:hypothetical protein [Bacteroidota bacterium]
MCRLLAVVSPGPINAGHHLDAFARICAASPEYQGHGWGCAVWRGYSWDCYRNLRPIWADDFRPMGDVRLLLAHARSAFRNEDIALENNMPFVDSDLAFVFNGEMHGVRLPINGRTGASRLFRFIQNLRRQENGSVVGDAVGNAASRVMAVVRKRAAHIRACNFILTDSTSLYVHSLFTGEPEYFTMSFRSTPGELVVCSTPYEDDCATWTPIRNDSLEVFPCSL